MPLKDSTGSGRRDQADRRQRFRRPDGDPYAPGDQFPLHVVRADGSLTGAVGFATVTGVDRAHGLLRIDLEVAGLPPAARRVVAQLRLDSDRLHTIVGLLIDGRTRLSTAPGLAETGVEVHCWYAAADDEPAGGGNCRSTDRRHRQ